jgi:Zn-dependent M16 (insulinase) family peptidase
VDQAKSDWPKVLAKLEEVRSHLVNRATMVANVTVDADNWATIEPELSDFLEALPLRTADLSTWTPTYDPTPEAFTVPANVNYVAKGANLLDLGYTRHGSEEVISHYLRSTWIWEQVRVQGGAYGGYFVYDSHSGALAYVSYRDPNLLRTLDVYDQTAGYLQNLELSQDELIKGIIGAIGNIDAYQLPDAKGYSAMARRLIEYTPAARQQYRTELLGTTAADFRAFADVLNRAAASGSVVVVGGPAAIEAADAERGIGFETTKVL